MCRAHPVWILTGGEGEDLCIGPVVARGIERLGRFAGGDAQAAASRALGERRAATQVLPTSVPVSR